LFTHFSLYSKPQRDGLGIETEKAYISASASEKQSLIFMINITPCVWKNMRNELREKLKEDFFTIDNIEIYLLFRR